MDPLGTTSSASAKPKSMLFGKSSRVGMAIMAIVFLVAVVFAANENDVIGWIIALVAFGWLLLATFVVVSIRRAAKFGASQLREAQNDIRSATGRAPTSDSSGRGGTRLKKSAARDADRGSDMRDQKLAHSFKIVQVQVRLVEENLGKDADVVVRALETIQITAHNGMGLVRGEDEEPVSGTVVD